MSFASENSCTWIGLRGVLNKLRLNVDKFKRSIGTRQRINEEVDHFATTLKYAPALHRSRLGKPFLPGIIVRRPNGSHFFQEDPDGVKGQEKGLIVGGEAAVAGSRETRPWSYRDPDAVVLHEEDGYFRCIRTSYSKEYDHLMVSGLYDELVATGLLISHQEVPGREGYYKSLYPQQLSFITYPYEWTFSQWRDAALAQLQICRIALKHGMVMKDATPFNFAFHNGRCLLIDTTSFQFFREQPWAAYRQFCQEFLAPLTLMYYRGTEWGSMFRAAPHGFDCSFTSRHLPRRSWLNTSVLLHIHLRARAGKPRARPEQPRKMTSQQLDMLFASLGSGIRGWKLAGIRQGWTIYYEDENSYQNEKEKAVEALLKSLQPRKVIDLGANTGLFTRLAARFADKVIAVEQDEYCADELSRSSGKHNFTIITGDIINPACGGGWKGEAQATLMERLGNFKANLVLSLALIHHLCIAQNVPLQMIASLLSELGDHVLVEFVPKSDPRVQAMLALREDIFPDYTEQGFVNAFEQYFELDRTIELAVTDRKLFLWKRKDS